MGLNGIRRGFRGFNGMEWVWWEYSGIYPEANIRKTLEHHQFLLAKASINEDFP